MVSIQVSALKSEASASGKIMVVESRNQELSVITPPLEESGYQVVEFNSCTDVVEQFQLEKPDLVLVDTTVPGERGWDICRQLADSRGDQYAPIFCLTAEESGDDRYYWVDVGADDYITKPVNAELLVARIGMALHSKQLYKGLYQHRCEINQYRNWIETEQSMAASLYSKMISANFYRPPNLDYLISPKALFNGDLLLSGKSPSGELVVMLGDFTGHGLAASIGVGPTAEIFYGMTAKGFGIREIVCEINRKLHKILPVEVFLAACIVSFHPDRSTINVCTGGLPDHYLYNIESGALRIIASANLPLGIVSSESYQLQIQRFDVRSHDRLYLFTDGVIEAKNPAGVQFGLEGVRRCFPKAQAPDQSPNVSKQARGGLSEGSDSLPSKAFQQGGFCQRIQEELDAYRNGVSQQDDITIAEVRCDAESVLGGHDSQNANRKSAAAPMHWKVAMEFQADVLRNHAPIPLMINTLMEIQGLYSHREKIFTIVTELFVNALDHGLLQLDSEIKSTAEGFLRYFDLREKRLQALKEGSIKVEFTHAGDEAGGCLEIIVEDSGAGFPAATGENSAAGETAFWGRGIHLVSSLCRSVEYLGAGNKVRAEFVWLK